MSLSTYFSLILSCLTLSTSSLEMQVARFQVSSVYGAGMDGGLLGISFLGGGRLDMEVCSQGSCCTTGTLNTEDDNWERDELNFFVGSQLGACRAKDLGEEVSIQLHHRGRDGLKLEEVRLEGSHHRRSYLSCPLRKKLDGNTLTVECTWMEKYQGNEQQSCNGHPDFCELTFDKVTFAGSHNAGTGQNERLLDCAFKNHDLDIREQLDFGMRFFDFDVIFSEHNFYCNGLETGHGKHPKYGFYQCFGELKDIFATIKDWLNQNPTESIVLYFGELQYPTATIGPLKQALSETFADSDSESVKINTAYKTLGSWPTLSEAVQSNERVFIFIRSEDVLDSEQLFMQEVQIAEDEPNPVINHDKAVTILSTYQSGDVDSSCSLIVENAEKSCALKSDLVKLAAFATFNVELNVKCLWEIARKCNPRLQDAVNTCLRLRPGSDPVINFLQLDYPNYPANRGINAVDMAFKMNLERTN